MRLCALFLVLNLTLTSYATNFVVHTGEVKGSQTLNTAGDEGLIEVGGAIVSSSIGTPAVMMSAADQRLLNKGTIRTTNSFEHGIASTGANVLIINSGTLTTQQIDSDGISSEGDNAVITNSGTIATQGVSAQGINSEGANAVITNSGTIATQGVSAQGINSEGANAVITNSGTIATTTVNAHGIRSIPNNPTHALITNSGAITTTGPGAHGILTESNSSASIINSGTIIASGSNAHGIRSAGIDTKITNSGTISIQGPSANGIDIFNSAANVVIINSGTIRSAQANALNLEGANPTLNLLRGSNLQGPVNITNAVKLSVETGLNLVLTLTAGNPGFASLGINAPFVVVGNTIAVIDPTGLALQADVVADLSDTILNGIYRHRTAFPCQCCNRCECSFWVEALGSYQERNHDNCIGYHNWQGGFLAGYDRPFWCGDVGLFAGASFGKAIVDQSTQKVETDTYFGGLSYETVWCKNFIGAALVAGYTRLDNDRFVMNNLAPDGVQTAHAKDNGFFISPEITGARQFQTCWLSPIVSGTLRYAGLFLGDYSEKGSDTNLSVKNRNLHLLSLRGELGVPFSKSCRNFCWSAEPYIGLLGRFQVADKRVSAELLGQSLSFDPGGPRNLAAFLFGFRGEQDVGCFNLFLNLETCFDNHRSARILGEGGVGVSF